MRCGDVRELGACIGRNGISVLFSKQSCKDGCSFTAAHTAGWTERTVRVADDVSAVALGFFDFGDSQFAVLVGFAFFCLVQIAFNSNGFILLRVLLMVCDNDRHPMLGVHIRAIGQFHGEIAGLADGNIRTGDGALGVCADNLDG